MTELTPVQQQLLDLFKQKIRKSIKESKVDYDATTFQPIKKVVIEFPLEFVCDQSFYIPEEVLFAAIGKIVCGIEEDTSTTGTDTPD